MQLFFWLNLSSYILKLNIKSPKPQISIFVSEKETTHIKGSICSLITPWTQLHFKIIPFFILFFESLISPSLLPQWVLNYRLVYLCICVYVCVRTNASALGLLSSSLLQAAAEPGQRWRRGSGPALLRLHPGVQLSARLFPFRRFRAPRLPLWQQLDWQGACLQRYVVSRGLRGWNKS